MSKALAGASSRCRSLHSPGRRYAWEADQEAQARLAEMPAAGGAALEHPVQRLLAGESDEVIPEGKRRQALLRLAGRSRPLGLNAQLGVYGETVDAVICAHEARVRLDRSAWDMLCKLLEVVEAKRDEPDSAFGSREPARSTTACRG